LAATNTAKADTRSVRRGKARAGDSKDRCAECVGNSEGSDKQTGRACGDIEAASHRWQYAADHEGVRAYGERAGG